MSENSTIKIKNQILPEKCFKQALRKKVIYFTCSFSKIAQLQIDKLRDA